jgi:hexosaminidase
VAQKDIPISTWEDSDGIFAYELDFGPVTAKFVEVVISGYDLPEDHSGFGNPAWIFVDEIEVR